MKIIAIANDTKGMAIRFLSQELRLMRPGCNILVLNSITDYVRGASFTFIKSTDGVIEMGGKIYQLEVTESMKDYHTSVMALLPEILA